MIPEVTAKIEVGGQDIIYNVAPRWHKLCEEVRSAPFHRPEWIAAYVRAFEPNGEVVLVTASARDRLLAVLPLIRKKGFYAGVPVVKLVGTANSHSVRFDIVRSSGRLGHAGLRAIWSALNETPDWHTLELPLFPQGGACRELMDVAAKDGYPTVLLLAQNSRVLRLQVNGNGEPAQVVGGPSRHFRHELRRFARVLAQETGSTPQVTRCSDPNPERLQEFFDLEESGWKGRRGSAINCHPETRSFYIQIAREGAAHGYFCLHSLEANGKMVAGSFSMVTPDGFFPMKIAHAEELRRGAPGHLLFNAILNECAEKQIPQLFFGGTDEHYKSLWTQETVPHFNAIVFSPAVRSRIAYHIRRDLLPTLGKLRRLAQDRFANHLSISKSLTNRTVAKKI